MMAPQLPAVPAALPALPSEEDFNLHDMRIFRTVPDARYYGIAALRGLVVIYDEEALHIEGIVEGAFYVREGQRAPANMDYERWLQEESAACRSRASQPHSRLKVSREVVKAVRWPKGDKWAYRLASGFTDGPFQDWAAGFDLIGKVVGIYWPEGERA